MLTSLSELMQMAQLKMVANLKLYYRRNVYSEKYIHIPFELLYLSIDTLCCHVQISSLIDSTLVSGRHFQM